MDKTRVLLCKRLSGQCKDVYMVVYFHLYWWWWAVLGCTGLYCGVLGCTGLYWTVLVFTKLNWAVVGCSRLYCGVLGFSGRSQQLFVCVFSHFDQCEKVVFCNLGLIFVLRNQNGSYT